MSARITPASTAPGGITQLDRPSRGGMLVGSSACSCRRHLTWRCECGAVTYGPALAEGCSLLGAGARALAVRQPQRVRM
jgi:hypothetical protein